MPDILIRGMEMPTSCYSCEIGPSDQMEDCCPFFSLTGEEQKAYQTKRHENCPVSKLPPHGDLISRKALFEEVYKVWGVEYDASDCNTLMDLINDAPVVVPAERREGDGD